MKKIFLVSILFCAVHAFAQTDAKQPLLMGDGLYTFRYENVEGTPFLNKEWIRSTIINSNQQTYKDVQLKMDLFQNNFIFSRNDENYTLMPDVMEVDMEGDAKTGKLIFKRGYSINKFIKPSSFVQVLAEGKISFLKFTKKEEEEFTLYNDATKYKRFKLVEQYFIKTGDQVTPINLNKKSLETASGAKWPQLEAWIKQNNLSGRDENSWMAATNYLNSL